MLLAWFEILGVLSIFRGEVNFVSSASFTFVLRPSPSRTLICARVISGLLSCVFALQVFSLAHFAPEGTAQGTARADERRDMHFRPLTKCGVLSRSGGYQLEQDVSSTNTCFSVQADNVVLNLNGHTLNYGTLPGTFPVFGVLGVACWDPDFGAKNPCGGTFNNLTVYGGTITQGPGAAPFSHGIRLGQGPGNGLHVHNVTFNLSANSSIPVYTTFAGTNASIYNNTINNHVTEIQNRHQEQGQSIKFADSNKVAGPAAIYGNHITGGAQGGIFSAVPGTRIYDNDVSPRGTYTNDFAIYAWADAGEVFHNKVTPILGRGIQIAGASRGVQVHDNTIVVIEQRDNQEYGGCQIGGAYGIQFDDLPQNATAFRNTVTAEADQCDAQALRVTDSRKGAGNLSHNNFYSAKRVGRTSSRATSFGTGGTTGFTSEGDKFVGDTSAVAFDWDGGQNLSFHECKLAKGANPSSDFVTFSFRNGKDARVSNVQFIDCAFENGAGKDSSDMKPILSNGDWPGPSEYSIEWTVTVSVHDQLQRPVPGADLSFRDALGHLAYEGKTNQAGLISVVLTEFRVYNTYSQVLQEFHTPYSATVAKKGCSATPSTSSFEVKEKISQKIGIVCEAN
jgi:hypothetical protein